MASRLQGDGPMVHKTTSFPDDIDSVDVEVIRSVRPNLLLCVPAARGDTSSPLRRRFNNLSNGRRRGGPLPRTSAAHVDLPSILRPLQKTHRSLLMVERSARRGGLSQPKPLFSLVSKACFSLGCSTITTIFSPSAATKTAELPQPQAP